MNALKALGLIVLLAFNAHRQQNHLVFSNTKQDSGFEKFEIKNGQTTLYRKTYSGAVTHSFNQIPVNFDNSEGNARYKMIVNQEFEGGNTTFEIYWMHNKSTQKYTGHIKSTTTYTDGRKPVQTVDSFIGKVN